MKLAEDLKKAVLQAAMQGKLTKQLETDSSVDELLKKIADEKAKNNQVWKAKKQPPIDVILETIDANEIPENWKWVKLSQIAHSYIGLTYSPSNVSSSGTIVLRSSNIQNGKMDYKDIVKVEMDIPENKMCKKGDILVCARNGSKSLVGKAAIIDADGMSFGAFMAIIKSPCNEFLYHYLSSPYFKKQMALDSSTVTVNQITQDMLFNACVPLPPIEEQQRIVEKLNQILPLIDEYGKEEDELIALCQNFPEEMKKSVLQSAMQGKLTEQLETDSSVDELLKKIADEKAKNNQVWKAKKQPPIDVILETIDANEIPENWKWVKLSQIAHSYIGLTYSPSNVSSSGTIVLRSSNIQNGKMDYKDIVKVEMDIPENKMCKKGDILVCARNGSKSLVGKAAIIDADGMSFGAFMAIIKSPCNEFLYHYLSSPYFKKQMALDSSTVTVNQITQDMLFNACVPLPPIEEQQRIVEKLNTILPIIDSMAVYGKKKRAGRPKQEEALAFISSLLGTKKSTVSKPVAYEITELTAKAKEELPAIVKKYADLMGVTYNRITIRHQKTRWGSCTKTGNLSFNCLILKMPETVRDYVIVHELAHRKELNHSTKFWTIVAEYCPWYKEAKQWLKNNGQSLMELK